MKFDPSAVSFWKFLFLSLVLAYGFCYAPYGINETDGGFLTGLAWQVLNGKALYSDVVYVRPPVPVWLRALELLVLPETWAVLGERWIFYGKVALYSGLGAAVLAQGRQRWMLAVFGFVASVHCYPAAAWHTVDGILFGVLSIWCWTNTASRWGAAFSGIALAACLLSKQSFYPMALVWGVLIALPAPGNSGPGRARRWAIGAFLAAITLFYSYLYFNNLLANFLLLTTGATSGGQAMQHGLLDYFRIQPVVAGLSAVVLAPVVWWFWCGQRGRSAEAGWGAWLLLLVVSYGWAIYNRQEFTAPFAQTRLLFGVAAVWGIYRYVQKNWPLEQALRFFALLGLSWCAALSWGYNLPVLFSTPWAFAALDISGSLRAPADRADKRAGWMSLLLLTLLLGIFRYGYEFVYRDGRRSAMHENLGAVFPALSGIYSGRETVELYRDLKALAQRYGPVVKTLPAFPQANFLTQTTPPLPLDWVVEREMQTGSDQVVRVLEDKKPVLLIEKRYLEALRSDPELALVRAYFQRGRVVEETGYFWVVVL